jgi:hypothetical protein
LKPEDIDDQFVQRFKNLNILHVCNNMYEEPYQNVTDEGLRTLKNLTTLYLSDIKSAKITNEGIKDLLNIDTLSLGFNDTITDEGIKLTNMKVLHLRAFNGITDKGIKFFTNL